MQKALCRESHEESPESRRLFGAGLGARPQCGFHISPQHTPRGKHSKAKMLTQKRAHIAPRIEKKTPRSPAPARTSPSAGAITGQTQHCAGLQFTIPSFAPTYCRVSAHKHRERKPRYPRRNKPPLRETLFRGKKPGERLRSRRFRTQKRPYAASIEANKKAIALPMLTVSA